MELRPGELYGFALADAYELESKVAQYPRIVVGQEVVDYLNAELRGAGTDGLSAVVRRISLRALRMLGVDTDSRIIVDYISNNFIGPNLAAIHPSCIPRAIHFAESQRAYWEAKQDTKLASRYTLLIDYLFHGAVRFELPEDLI